MSDDANPQGIPRPRIPLSGRGATPNANTPRPMIPIHSKLKPGRVWMNGDIVNTTAPKGDPKALGKMLSAAIGGTIRDTATQVNNMDLRTGKSDKLIVDTSAMDNSGMQDLAVGEGNDPQGTERPRIPLKGNDPNKQ